ncbi:uncharacterized protein LOC142333026 [Lycorma delicatula]|uniref:uncharacterized protein LOC142333026 n=1 Tax=Lycorma delicatula TaxID=130591 RepID=UPI003F511E1F
MQGITKKYLTMFFIVTCAVERRPSWNVTLTHKIVYMIDCFAAIAISHCLKPCMAGIKVVKVNAGDIACLPDTALLEVSTLIFMMRRDSSLYYVEDKNEII